LAIFAACSTQSGPSYTLRTISPPNQTVPTYRVSCLGLLDSSQTCVRVAEETCQAKPITWLGAVDGVSNNQPVKDAREMTFMCGAPVAQQPVAQQPVPQQPVPQQPVPQQPVQQQEAAQPQAKPAAPQARLLLQGNANFATDSATLSAIAKENLDHFMAANKGANLRRVTVTGYTDKTGSEAHNRALSKARAEAVVQYLRDGGLEGEQFVAQGLGSADPVASNATAEGRSQNRRVDVRVVAE